MTWTPDTVAPDPVANLRLAGYEGGDTATIAWDSPTDPKLADGTDGSGVAAVELTATVNGVARPPVALGLGEDSYEIGSVSAGNAVQVSLKVTDRAGNQRVSSLNVASLAAILEDPEVDAAAADAYQAEYPGVGRPVAEAWIRSQNSVLATSSGDVVEPLRTAASVAGFGGAYFDNTTRQFAVRLTSSANRAAVDAVVATLPANTRIESAPHSAEHLGNVQSAIEDSIVDLLDAGKVSLSASEAATRIDIEIASDASAAEKARIRAVDGQGVALVFSEVDPEEITGADDASCKWPYCDPPLRGGIRINLANGIGTQVGKCTLGFVVQHEDGRRVGLTAGHCITPSEATRWVSAPVDGVLNYAVGTDGAYGLGGSTGDWGLIELTSGLKTIRSVFVTKSKTDGPAQTTRNMDYKIRAAAQNVEGAIVCFSGGVSGSRCGRVSSRRHTQKIKNGPTLRNIAKAQFCSNPGDSGGPVYKAGIAYGVISGHQPRRASSNCRYSYYTGAVTVQAKAKVSFLP